MLPHVGHAEQFLEEGHHEQKLFVIWLTHVGLDGDAVVHLESERNYGVVDKNDILYVSVLYDSQILDVYALNRVNAMLSVKSMLNDQAVWVNEV